MTLEKACNILHVDQGTNDDLINGLLAAIPGYIETVTGMKPGQQAKEPLADTVGGFLLTLWYYSDHADDARLMRTIENLLKCLTLKARK